ncbi:MAG: lipase family alpha/beta hydrolase [Marinicellaceae bacterium]
MPKKPKNLSSDLQGVSKLTIDAVKGTTKVVEALHSTISQFTPILGDPKEKTKGLTGVIYQSINTVTHLLGEGINAVLKQTRNMHGEYSGEHKLSKTREAVASAMNGVLGDHFDKGDNPLAINMSFRVNGQSLDKEQLKALFNETDKPITILIHGLCMNDLQWTRDGHNHGQLLIDDLGHTVIYLHYNTGLHVSENGRQLSELLYELELNDTVSINFLCHSMGGLVVRSACYYAKVLNHSWHTLVNKMIFLGTPHHGALLAKGGHWADVFLQISPYSAPFAKITKVRSNGLHDLRHGCVVDEDWLVSDERKIVPLPKNVNCYAIGTTTSEYASEFHEKVVGDGLVSIDSALGVHQDKKLNLNIPKANQWTGTEINHMQLLSNEKIYQVIKGYLL